MARDTTIRNMWDVISDIELPAPSNSEEQDPTAARRTGRVKTRLLGFEHSNGAIEDIGTDTDAGPVLCPVGWLAIVEGPGRGATFPLTPGVSQIGRGEGQGIRIDFGDLAISREGHAMIAYDDETRSFYLGFGGKSNLVRRNGKPVLGTEALEDGDRIRLGETTLMLVALCGEEFSWTE